MPSTIHLSVYFSYTLFGVEGKETDQSM